MNARVFAVVGLALCVAGCGSTTPTTPSGGGGGTTVLPLAVSCPASVTTQTANATLAVAYAPPGTTGGTAPVTASCSPASGSSFPRGTNTVTCTATDAAAKTASCTFTVVVNAIPTLKGTKFLAFGDSMTSGEILNAFRSTIVDATRAYPALLQTALTARYTAQSVSVVNDGASGETLFKDGERYDLTKQRFNLSLVVNRPDVLMLLEGVNDLNNGDIPNADIASVLGTMVDEAYAAGVKQVYLATLPPQIPGKLRSPNAARVPDLNTRIILTAVAKRATPVDLYGAMNSDLANMINGDDGLHPLPAGYAMMAQTFLTAIKGNFEQTTATARPAGIR